MQLLKTIISGLSFNLRTIKLSIKRIDKVIGMLILMLLLVIPALYSCSEEPPVIPPITELKDTLVIAVTDSAIKSITLNVKSSINNRGSLINVYRRLNSQDEVIAEYNIEVTDTTIIDDNSGSGLQINTSYKYFAVRKTGTGENKDTSNLVEAKTLEPANLDYNWNVFEMGNGDHLSILYDVWGTSKNNIYACGVININDTVYGIIKWNGVNWQPEKKNGGISVIYGFSENDIWAAGAGVFHYNGIEWKQIDSYTDGIQSIPLDTILFDNREYTSLWGTSSTNMFLGSSKGRILHWNGRKAEIVYTSNSDIPINDMDGSSNENIFAVGSNFAPPLLAAFYNGNFWQNIIINSQLNINSIRVDTKDHIFLGGDGLFEMKGQNISKLFNPGFYVWDIYYDRKTGLLAAAGVLDGIIFFNGAEWKSYWKLITEDNSIYNGLTIVDGTVVIVGRNDTKAKIAMGQK